MVRLIRHWIAELIVLKQTYTVLTRMLDHLIVRRKFMQSACCAAAAAVDRYFYCGPAHDVSSKPAAAAAVDRWDRQTDGRTLDCCTTLTACYTDRVINTVEHMK